jgi:hypothetical protein
MMARTVELDSSLAARSVYVLSFGSSAAALYEYAMVGGVNDMDRYRGEPVAHFSHSEVSNNATCLLNASRYSPLQLARA